MINYFHNACMHEENPDIRAVFCYYVPYLLVMEDILLISCLDKNSNMYGIRRSLGTCTWLFKCLLKPMSQVISPQIRSWSVSQAPGSDYRNRILQMVPWIT